MDALKAMNASIIITFVLSDFLYSEIAWEDTSASIEKTDQLEDDARFAGADASAVVDGIILVY